MGCEGEAPAWGRMGSGAPSIAPSPPQMSAKQDSIGVTPRPPSPGCNIPAEHPGFVAALSQPSHGGAGDIAVTLACP